MENNHKLAMYVSYYLARFNNLALENLEYKNWEAAFDDVSEKLAVKRLSVRNWRDEFDPLFEHRVGWYQRPMAPSRIRVVQLFENLTEPEIREIVIDILSGKIKENHDEESQLLAIVPEEEKGKSNKTFISRGPTGRAAEEFFIEYQRKKGLPLTGELIDTRDMGCGYDFKIMSTDSEIYIEVKGMSTFSGGILFTDKEWKVATEHGEKYFLCIVKNVGGDPEIKFIKNPMSKITPQKTIYTVLQINWTVSENELNKIND